MRYSRTRMAKPQALVISAFAAFDRLWPINPKRRLSVDSHSSGFIPRSGDTSRLDGDVVSGSRSGQFADVPYLCLERLRADFELM